MFNKQKGATMIFFLIAMAVGTGLLLQNFVYNVSTKSVGNTPGEKLLYINDSAKILNAWYENNTWTIDSDPNAIATSAIISQSALVARYGLNVASSKRISKDGVSYHVIAAWLPSVEATGTAFDVDTGIFNPGVPENVVQYTLVNGYSIESKNLAATAKKVTKVTGLLENWFLGRVNTASLYDTDVNWFRNPSCATVDTRFLGCFDTPTNIQTVLLPQGISDTYGLLNAWGQPIFASNTQLYKVNIQTFAPWGLVSTGVAQSN